MRLLHKVILIFIFFGINLFAQNFSIKLLRVKKNEIVYSLIIKIKADSATKSPLGNATLRFSFDNDKLFFPLHPSKGYDYSFAMINPKQYSCTVTKPTLNTISINIYYKRGHPLIISDSLVELVKLNFRKQFVGVELKYDHFISEFFSPNSSKPWNVNIVF